MGFISQVLAGEGHYVNNVIDILPSHASLYTLGDCSFGSMDPRSVNVYCVCVCLLCVCLCACVCVYACFVYVCVSLCVYVCVCTCMRMFVWSDMWIFGARWGGSGYYCMWMSYNEDFLHSGLQIALAQSHRIERSCPVYFAYLQQRDQNPQHPHAPAPFFGWCAKAVCYGMSWVLLEADRRHWPQETQGHQHAWLWANPWWLLTSTGHLVTCLEDCKPLIQNWIFTLYLPQHKEISLHCINDFHLPLQLRCKFRMQTIFALAATHLKMAGFTLRFHILTQVG